MTDEQQVNDAATVMNELDGGVFMEKVSRALSDVAEGVCAHERQGKVVIELTMSQVGEGRQMVNIAHALKYTRPTRRGKSSEEDTTSTPLYVGQRGKLTIMPDTQQPLFAESDKEKA